MYKILIVVVLIGGFAINTKGQNNIYGISFGMGGGTILKQSLEGGASYDLNSGFSVGLQYGRKLTDKTQFITGLNLYNNRVMVTSNPNPDFDIPPKNYDLRLIYIPLVFKFAMGKYLYMTSGLLGDIDISKVKSITDQSGIGATLGIGTEISIGDNFSIQINPYLNFHGLLTMDKEYYPERVLDSGLKVNFNIMK